MSNMVAENLVNIPQVPTNVALTQMVSEQFGTDEIDDTSSQGQIDTITTLIRLIFFHLKKQQELTNNLIAASTAASGVDGGIPARAPNTTPITENAATVTVASPGASTMYHDSKFFPKMQIIAKETGKFTEGTFRSWRQKFIEHNS